MNLKKINDRLDNIKFYFKYSFVDEMSIEEVIEMYFPSTIHDIVHSELGPLEIKVPRHDYSLGNVDDLARVLHEATLGLIRVAELVRGDNSLLGLTLKGQLLSTIETIRSQLSAPAPERSILKSQTDSLADYAKRIDHIEKASEATSKIGERLIQVALAVRKIFEQWPF